MNLSGKKVIVTGAGRGIGRAIALAFAGEGSAVAAAARTVKEIEDTADEVRRQGAKSAAIRTDVTVESEVENLFSRSAEELGGIDILVNNAGAAVKKPFEETTPDDFDRVMAVNARGVFLCMKEAVRHMRSGIIINISSGAGLNGLPELSAYSASKFAVIGLTESVAREMSHIRVYAICPGGVDTEMHQYWYGKRPALKPEGVARVIIETCKDEPETGSSIEV